MTPRRALFLDRDGTIIEDRNFLADPAGVALLPGVAEALRALAARGWALVVISNQSGVGRGYFDRAAVDAVNARMAALLAAEGVSLDAVHYCPHAPDAGCPCRKPAPGLFLDAARERHLDLPRSASIGDKPRDPTAARAAGCGLNLLLGDTPPDPPGAWETVPDWPAARRRIEAWGG